MTSENAQKISLISEVMRLLVTPKCSLHSFPPFHFSSTQYELPEKYFYLSVVLNKRRSAWEHETAYFYDFFPEIDNQKTNINFARNRANEIFVLLKLISGDTS